MLVLRPRAVHLHGGGELDHAAHGKAIILLHPHLLPRPLAPLVQAWPAAQVSLVETEGARPLHSELRAAQQVMVFR